MKLVAIIGTIGSGKSTILDVFEKIYIPGLKIHTINMDQVTKSLRSSSEALKHNITKQFGNQGLNPDYILDSIFEHDKAYNTFNAIYEPFLYDYLKNIAINQAKSGVDVMVVEGASLIHSQRLLDLFDLVIQTELSVSICRERVRSRVLYNETQISNLIQRTNPDVNYELKYNALHRIPTLTNMLTLYYNVEWVLLRIIALNSDNQVIKHAYKRMTHRDKWLGLDAQLEQRAYHNKRHMESVFINTALRLRYSLGVELCAPALLASLYHDVVYDPESTNNEINSVHYLRNIKHDELLLGGVDTACEYIMLTKHIWHNVETWPKEDVYARAFLLSDIAVFTYSFEAIIDYEKAIRAEFKNVDDVYYQHHRLMFLTDRLLPLIEVALQYESDMCTIVRDKIYLLIEYVDLTYNNTTEKKMTNIPPTILHNNGSYNSKPITYTVSFDSLNSREQTPAESYADTNATQLSNDTNKIVERIAVYQGSFDPLHIGHLDIINQALRIFDKVIVLRCINGAKAISSCQELDISKLPVRVVYEVCAGSVVDYIKTKTNNITIIRGIRNGTDLQCENDYIKHLQAMFNTTTDCGDFPPVVYLPASAELAHVSSSAIKAIIRFNPEYAESLTV